jgi:hypothetical protein
MVASSTTVTPVAGIPSKVTPVAPLKPDPVIVTGWPPASGPVVGVSDVIAEAGVGAVQEVTATAREAFTVVSPSRSPVTASRSTPGVTVSRPPAVLRVVSSRLAVTVARPTGTLIEAPGAIVSGAPPMVRPATVVEPDDADGVIRQSEVTVPTPTTPSRSIPETVVCAVALPGGRDAPVCVALAVAEADSAPTPSASNPKTAAPAVTDGAVEPSVCSAPTVLTAASGPTPRSTAARPAAVTEPVSVVLVAAAGPAAAAATPAPRTRPVRPREAVSPAAQAERSRCDKEDSPVELGRRAGWRRRAQ